MNHGTIFKLSGFKIKILNYDILCVVSIIPFNKECHSEHGTFVLVESMAMCYAGPGLCI